MAQKQILKILYDLAMVTGGEATLTGLLTKFLQQLLSHTSFPFGMVLLTCEHDHSDSDSQPVKLAQAIGDYLILPQVGETIEVPEILLGDTPALISDPQLMNQLPVHQDYYTTLLRLPIPGHGVIILAAPKDFQSDLPFTTLFGPVLNKLGAAIEACKVQESYTYSLMLDRDTAQNKLMRFRAALDTSSDVVLLINPETMELVDYNASAIKALGFEDTELKKFLLTDLLLDTKAEKIEKINNTLIEGNASSIELEDRIKRRDNSEYSVEVSFTLLDQPNIDFLLIANIRDITQRKIADEQIFNAKEQAEVTLQSIGDGVITTNHKGEIKFLNPAAEKLTGWSNHQCKGHPLEEVFILVDENTQKPVDSTIDECLRYGIVKTNRGQITLIHRSGRNHAIEVTTTPIRDSQDKITGAVLIFRDVTETRQLAKELTWQASHDPLTGLVNRSEFERRLNQIIQKTKVEGDVHALLYMDLDQFKIVNDTCGHLAGDGLLNQLTLTLKSQIRVADTLARLGGDEFGVLLEDCPEDQAYQIADKLRNSVKEFRFVWEDKIFEIGVSIGLVHIDQECGTMAEALSAADVACYNAKDLGRDRIYRHEPDDQLMTQRHQEMQWVSHIKQALKEDRFTLFCQAIVPIKEGSSHTQHYEVLVRMVDREGNFVPPNNFIPSAERYNLMTDIDRWVVRQTFAYLAALQQEMGVCSLYALAINLSGTSINDESFLEYIKELSKKYGIHPRQVNFEVTETAAISNLVQANHFIKELKALGFTFSLDDFGSGLSSFGYLKSLPVDYLKIDGSFVKDIVTDPIDFEMVKAINQIGHVMGIQTIAEFVENDEIKEQLISLGVDYAQGYGIDKPKPIQEVFSFSVITD